MRGVAESAIRGRVARTVAVAAICAGCVGETRAQPAPAAMSTTGVEPVIERLPLPAAQEEELGAVDWGTDLDAALSASRASGKPVFLLFTEVPGCNTVRGFANGALRDPLIVEAIEDEFHPVVVRNNVGGEERAILDSFDEPAWNNPVVRFLGPDRRDLVPRYASGWTAETLLGSMLAALEAAGRPVPAYLRALVAELTADRATSVFSMYCFWSGEVKLAGLDGVVATRPGFAQGREVVEVVWDRRRTTQARLYAQAADADAASGVVLFDESQRAAAAEHFEDVVAGRGKVRFSPKDDKYQLRALPWRVVAMTPGQATALNRAVTNVSPSAASARILSPRQVAQARSARAR